MVRPVSLPSPIQKFTYVWERKLKPGEFSYTKETHIAYEFLPSFAKNRTRRPAFPEYRGTQTGNSKKKLVKN